MICLASKTKPTLEKFTNLPESDTQISQMRIKIIQKKSHSNTPNRRSTTPDRLSEPNPCVVSCVNLNRFIDINTCTSQLKPAFQAGRH